MLNIVKRYFFNILIDRNVTRQLSEDTVLFVLGDHGMTVTGDHGGDSEDELTAGLFIYSPAKITLSQPVQVKVNSIIGCSHFKQRFDNLKVFMLNFLGDVFETS